LVVVVVVQQILTQLEYLAAQAAVVRMLSQVPVLQVVVLLDKEILVVVDHQ
jgi:hypothetical protein